MSESRRLIGEHGEFWIANKDWERWQQICKVAQFTFRIRKRQELADLCHIISMHTADFLMASKEMKLQGEGEKTLETGNIEAVPVEIAHCRISPQDAPNTDRISEPTNDLQRQNKQLKKEKKKLNTIIWKLKQGIEVNE